jgi:hypothetical protein
VAAVLVAPAAAEERDAVVDRAAAVAVAAARVVAVAGAAVTDRAVEDVTVGGDHAARTDRGARALSSSRTSSPSIASPRW